jgi:hypothetical protein
MDVCLRLFCVCVGSGLATGWSPVEGVLPTVLGLRNWSETKLSTDALCSEVGATGKREREREREIILYDLHKLGKSSVQLSIPYQNIFCAFIFLNTLKPRSSHRVTDVSWSHKICNN